MRVAIIDDKALNVKLLQDLLGELAPQLDIVGTAESVKTGTKLIEQEKPELVFLDIDMGDGYGFDVVQRSQFQDFEVVFVTAFPNYALKSFDYSPLHYLVKPVSEDELLEAIDRFEHRRSKEGRAARRSITLTPRDTSSKRICLPDQEKLIFVDIHDIIYCEASGSYTIFHLLDQADHVISKSLNTYEEMLKDDDFFRIHDKYLVNLSHVTTYLRGRGGEVGLSNGDKLSVSVRRRDGFLKEIQGMT